MTFKSLFGQFTILSLNLVNFRVPCFHVSHLTHETFKLCLQNTLNMSKTARVYFGALHGALNQLVGSHRLSARYMGGWVEFSELWVLDSRNHSESGVKPMELVVERSF